MIDDWDPAVNQVHACGRCGRRDGEHTTTCLEVQRTETALALARPQLALPPATGRGYDPKGPTLWHVAPWRDAVQETWHQLHARCDEYRREDERAMNARAAVVLHRRRVDDHQWTAAGLTRVEPGQQWTTRTGFPTRPRTVTAVDRALVDTDHGRTTVFHLNRHWQLLKAQQETR